MGWGFSALVHALPAPDSCKPNKFYLFLYNIVQFCAANLSLVRGVNSPGVCAPEEPKQVILVPNPPKPPTP